MRRFEEINSDMVAAEQAKDYAKSFELLREMSAAEEEIEHWWFGLSLSEKQTLCAAWKDGRCVVLPCKVGDTVYRVYNTRGCSNCTNLHSSCDGISCPDPFYAERKFTYSMLDDMQDIKLTRPEATLKGGAEE